jgi:hypothetical protein
VPRFDDCLQGAIATGKISKAEGQELAGRIDAYENQLNLRGEVSPASARSEAQAAVIRARRGELARKRRMDTLQAIAIHRATQNVRSHTRGIGTGLNSLLVKDLGREAGYLNIEQLGTSILADAHRMFMKGMAHYRTKNLGLSQDKQGLRNMVRELFGANTGDANARIASGMWSDTAEYLRKRFNRAGGAIPKLEDWGMPQNHDAVRLMDAGKDQWIRDITPLLDLSRMSDDLGYPLTQGQTRMLLDTMFERISTGGLSDLIPGKQGGVKLANSRRDHRVLAFKDADSWLAYHDKYGTSDLYATLTDHLSGMANDIAKLEIFGPNPELTYRTLRDLAKKHGVSARNLGFTDSIWNVVSGKANQVNMVRLADFANATRHLLVSAKLGSAFLSAISDIAYLRATSKFNGLPASKVLMRQMQLMNPANAVDREAAILMNLGGEAWVNRALAANRFVEVTGAGFSAKVADFTMRASLLSPWTDAGRKAFGMEFMRYIQKHADLAFDQLPKELRNGFVGYGINPAHWDVLRTTTPMRHRELDFFSIENLMARENLTDKEKTTLASLMQSMVASEMDRAIPMPDSRVRAITTGGGQARGTVVGELARMAGMFKSFPITVITSHLYRGALMHGTKNKLTYLANLTIASMVMGGVALQGKEIVRGRNPRNMTDPRFWAAAYIQGGGSGIWGDFLYADANRFGRGPLRTLLGPGYDLGEDILKLTTGTAHELARGKTTRLGADMVKFIETYMPGGSIWYARAAFERAVLDQLRLMVDPKARQRFRRITSGRRVNYGQSYWWNPGQAKPSQAPSLRQAIGR